MCFKATLGTFLVLFIIIVIEKQWNMRKSEL